MQRLRQCPTPRAEGLARDEPLGCCSGNSTGHHRLMRSAQDPVLPRVREAALNHERPLLFTIVDAKAQPSRRVRVSRAGTSLSQQPKRQVRPSGRAAETPRDVSTASPPPAPRWPRSSPRHLVTSSRPAATVTGPPRHHRRRLRSRAHSRRSAFTTAPMAGRPSNRHQVAGGYASRGVPKRSHAAHRPLR